MTALKKSPAKPPKTPKAPKAPKIPKVKKVTAESAAAPQKRISKKVAAPAKAMKEKSGDELIADSFDAMSKVVDSLGTTLEMLVQKMESIAYHTIATEEILAELVAANGINLARVNARIRAKIAAGTDNHGNANQAIDVAAAIASPPPRR